MILVGLSGKTTAANILVREHAMELMSFAAPLKEAVRILFNFSSNQLRTPEGKAAVDPRWGITPRRALQIVGTDWCRRQICSDFWGRHFLMSVQDKAAVVVDDVRFSDEAQVILSLGGKIIHINRLSNQLLRSEDENFHESECITGIRHLEIDNDVEGEVGLKIRRHKVLRAFDELFPVVTNE